MKRNSIRAIWNGIIQRCRNPKCTKFKDYGARGITVCDRWSNSFEAFRDDMGERPSSQYSVNRIDNNGPYSPENCEWATAKTQARNRRDSNILTVDGVSKTLAEWSEETGLERSVIHHRINLRGWTVEKAVRTPPKRRIRLITFNGVTKRLSEWARSTGIKCHTIMARLDCYGWDVERALTVPVE